MAKNIVFSTAIAISVLAAPQARASWGCEVLLCLSNPAGPMAVSQCVPPIQRLYSAIFKFPPDPFPTCLMVSGSGSASSGNYAYVGKPTFYDACPAGTNPEGLGSYAAVGRPPTPPEAAAMKPWARQPFVMTSAFVEGVGDGSGYHPRHTNPMPTKVCVGKYLGKITHAIGSSIGNSTQIVVNIYNRVVLVNPAADGFNINVIRNNNYFRTIRPYSQSTMRNL